jgi:hypothetical protein
MRAALARGPDGKPADLRLLALVDRGAQHIGQQLRPQADSQHRPVGGEVAGQQALFHHQPGVLGVLPGAHGSAQHHQAVHRVRSGQIGRLRYQADRPLVASSRRPVGQVDVAAQGAVQQGVNPHGAGDLGRNS